MSLRTCVVPFQSWAGTLSPVMIKTLIGFDGSAAGVARTAASRTARVANAVASRRMVRLSFGWRGRVGLPRRCVASRELVERDRPERGHGHIEGVGQVAVGVE